VDWHLGLRLGIVVGDRGLRMGLGIGNGDKLVLGIKIRD